MFKLFKTDIEKFYLLSEKDRINFAINHFYEMWDLYFNNFGVLDNINNIKDQTTLELYEHSKVQKNISNLPPFEFTTEYLFSIHEILFKDIYCWAGKQRYVNMIKSQNILDGRSIEYNDWKTIKSDL